MSEYQLSCSFCRNYRTPESIKWFSTKVPILNTIPPQNTKERYYTKLFDKKCSTNLRLNFC